MNNLENLSIEEIDNLFSSSELDEASKIIKQLKLDKEKYNKVINYAFKKLALELDKNPPRHLDEHSPMSHY